LTPHRLDLAVACGRYEIEIARDVQAARLPGLDLLDGRVEAIGSGRRKITPSTGMK
jgi:hypothetical protein